ncbi:MAG: SDR family NAD(P)-dependent oxidoreductase [Parachlamydiaceae bacterium]
MKWTLVTGGAKGLGAEICQALAAEGRSVLVHYHTSQPEADRIAEACRQHGVDAEAICGDFSSLQSTALFIKECHNTFPQIENLINNVGNYLVKPGSETTPEEWNSLFQTNLNAPFALCQAFLPSLRQCTGSIINIGVTGVNNIHADVQRTAYMATKMGLWMVTKSLARELASAHVRVNMVSPAYLENAVDLPSNLAKLPMGRPAAFSDVLAAIAFLLRKENAYITGQNIEVGGGIGLIH